MAQYNFQNETVTTDKNNNVISSASLTPQPTIQTVAPTPDTTNYNGITGGVTQSIMNDYANLNAQQQAAQANQQATGSNITDLMQQLTGKTADTQAANDVAGVNTETANLNKYAQTLADLNAQASSLNRESQAIPLQTQENNRNTGATDAGVAPQNAGALRLNALKALSIGQQSDIAAAAATGSNLRLQAAKDKAQQIIDLKYKPIEDQIAIKQKQYDLNKDTLDAIDKKRSEALQLSIQKEAQDAADKKANDKAIADAVTQAAAQGAPQDIVQAAAKAKSSLEAAQILGKYNGDFLKYEMLKEQTKTEKLQQGQISANILKTNTETAKTNAEIKKIKTDITNNVIANNPNVDPSKAGMYAGALSVILGSDKFTKEQKAAVTNAINNGQDPFAVIKNQAKNIMGQTEATKVTNFETAKSQVEDIKNALNNYYANGGKTSLLSGNYEKVINNLGSVNDPKLVELATQVSSALQIYRNAVSGTAYSVQEGRDIASIFPGINKSQGLNDAIISGRLKSFQSIIDSSYRSVLGSTYDQINNSGITPTPPQSPNPFNQAIGKTSNIPLQGAIIISGTTPTGLLNFNIPK